MRTRTLAQLAGPALFAVGIWFAVGWLPTQTSSVGERQDDAQAEISALVTELEAARSVAGVTDDLDAGIEAAEAAVPSASLVAEFVREAGAAGDLTGVTIDQIAPLAVSSDSDSEGIERLPFGTSSILVSIGATGDYGALISFMDELTAMDRLVLVDIVELRAEDSDTTTLLLDLELRIFTTANLTADGEFEDDLLLFDEEDEADR